MKRRKGMIIALNIKSNKFKYSGNWAILTVVVIACIIVLNVIVQMILNKFPFKIDLTPSKMYELTAESKEVLKGVDKSVSIVKIQSGSQTSPVIDEIVDRYAKANSNISVKTLDAERNPLAVSKYSNVGSEVRSGSIAVECGDNFRLIDLYDLYGFDQYGSPQSIQAEAKITAAIVKVTRDGAEISVGFLTGHGEDTETGIDSALQTEGIPAQEVNLAFGTLPDEVNLLFCIAPTVDFQPEEIDALDAFLKGGGALQLICTIQREVPVRLAAFLNEWGLVVQNDFVLEMDSRRSYSGNPLVFMPSLSRHTITQSLLDNNLSVIFPMSKSITILWEDKDYIHNESLLTSSPSSFARTNMQSTSLSMEEGDTQGPITVAAISERYRYEDTQKVSEGRIFISGSVSAFAGQLISGNQTNLTLLQNIMAWQTDTEEGIYIRPKVPQSDQMRMTDDIALICIGIVLAVMPLAIIVWGIFVFFRRRKL